MPTPPRSSSSRTLTVPDAATEHAFLTLAQQRWRDAHPNQAPRRGHPLERARLYPLIDTVLDALCPTRDERWPTHLQQSTVITRLLVGMSDEQFPSFSERTVNKSVRLYRLERSNFRELKKGGNLSWLETHRSPVGSQLTASATEMATAMRTSWTHLQWLIVVRYALGRGAFSVPSSLVLDPTLHGHDFPQALCDAVGTLGHRLMTQHPQSQTFDTYAYSELLAHVKSKKFQPLSAPHPPVSRHKTAPSRPSTRR